MKFLLLAALFLIGCSKEETRLDKEIIVIKSISEKISTCFKYPTYVSYPTVFGIQQEVPSKKVYIVIEARSDCSVRYSTKNGNFNCGVHLATESMGYWSSAINGQDNLEVLQRIDCSELGKIFPRK